MPNYTEAAAQPQYVIPIYIDPTKPVSWIICVVFSKHPFVYLTMGVFYAYALISYVK